MKIKNKDQYHWMFIVFFWFILGTTIWAQMIEDYNVLDATYQVVLVLLCSILLAHFLSDILLPNALRKNKMRLFAMQALLIVLFLSFCLALIYTAFSDVSFRTRLYPDEANMTTLHFLWARFCGSVPAAILINGTACGIRFY